MASIRNSALMIAVVALLLPPRWCCAIPGIQAECCEACQAQAESSESCCDCASPEKASPAKRPPCKCLCHDQQAQLAKGPELDHALPVATWYLLPALLPNMDSRPCYLIAQAPPPHDVHSRLCRWLF
jgi:hypothetical protein